MRRVVLESPFGKDPNRFIPYARACIKHSLSLGEAPMVMHLLYTQPGVLCDLIPEERELGMRAAFSWYGAADACVVYRNYGISKGMEIGMQFAVEQGLPVEMRELQPFEMPFSGLFHQPFPDHSSLTATQMQTLNEMFDGNGFTR